MAPRKRVFKRRVHKKRPTVRSLAKKISRVAIADRPTYHVYDDISNDGQYNPLDYITVSNTISYKYVGLSYGSSFGTGIEGMFQGTGEGNISGQSVRVHSFSVNGYVYNNPNPDGQAISSVRLVWFWDSSSYQPYLGGWDFPFGQSQILGGYDGASSIIRQPSVHSFYNPNVVGPRKRFKVLKDMTILFSPGGTSVRRFRFKVKLGKNVAFPVCTESTVIPSQWMGLAIISDVNSVGTTDQPTMSLQTRVCYSL